MERVASVGVQRDSLSISQPATASVTRSASAIALHNPSRGRRFENVTAPSTDIPEIADSSSPSSDYAVSGFSLPDHSSDQPTVSSSSSRSDPVNSSDTPTRSSSLPLTTRQILRSHGLTRLHFSSSSGSSSSSSDTILTTFSCLLNSDSSSRVTKSTRLSRSHPRPRPRRGSKKTRPSRNSIRDLSIFVNFENKSETERVFGILGQVLSDDVLFHLFWDGNMLGLVESLLERVGDWETKDKDEGKDEDEEEESDGESNGDDSISVSVSVSEKKQRGIMLGRILFCLFLIFRHDDLLIPDSDSDSESNGTLPHIRVFFDTLSTTIRSLSDPQISLDCLFEMFKLSFARYESSSWDEESPVFAEGLSWVLWGEIIRHERERGAVRRVREYRRWIMEKYLVYWLKECTFDRVESGVHQWWTGMAFSEEEEKQQQQQFSTFVQLSDWLKQKWVYSLSVSELGTGYLEVDRERRKEDRLRQQQAKRLSEYEDEIRIRNRARGGRVGQAANRTLTRARVKKMLEARDRKLEILQWSDANAEVVENRMDQSKTKLDQFATRLQQMLAVLTGHSFHMAELSQVVELSRPKVLSGRKNTKRNQVELDRTTKKKDPKESIMMIPFEDEMFGDELNPSSSMAASLPEDLSIALNEDTESASASTGKVFEVLDSDQALSSSAATASKIASSRRLHQQQQLARRRKRPKKVDREEIILHPIEDESLPLPGSRFPRTPNRSSRRPTTVAARARSLQSGGRGARGTRTAAAAAGGVITLKRKTNEGDQGNGPIGGGVDERFLSTQPPRRSRRTPGRRRSLATTTGAGLRTSDDFRKFGIGVVTTPKRQRSRVRRPKSSAPRLWDKFVVPSTKTPPRASTRSRVAEPRFDATTTFTLERIARKRQKIEGEKKQLIDELGGIELTSSVKKVPANMKQSAESVRNFARAESVHARLRDLGRKEAALVARQVDVYHDGSFEQLLRDQALEVENQKAEWRQLWVEYQSWAEKSKENLKDQFLKEEASLEDDLHKDSPTLRFSRKVLDLQRRVELLIERKKYHEAGILQQRLQTLQTSERERHSDHLQRTRMSKMNALQKSHALQERRLREEYNQKLRELQLRNERECKSMQIRHRNAREAALQNQRKRTSVIESKLKLQMEVLRSHDAKSSIDFSNLHLPGVEEIAKVMFTPTAKRKLRVSRARRSGTAGGGTAGSLMTPRTRARSRAPEVIGSPIRPGRPTRGRRTGRTPGRSRGTRLLPFRRTSFFDRSRGHRQ